MSIMGWLVMGLVLPALSVRSDSCADELEVVLADIETRRATLTRHGLSYPEPESEDEEFALHEKADLVCCCKASRCDANELGAGGARAQEVQGDKGPLCCKYTDPKSCGQSAWNAAPRSELCLNLQEQELSDFAKHVGPNTWQRPHMSQEELAATQKECEAEIKSFYTKVEEWASGKDTFHGHWIRTVHAKHLAEEISYQLFIEGMPFGVGSGAVRLFTLPQPVKMLWSGTPPDVRDEWKKKEHAGELSKETAFGKVVEAAGTLKSCDFGGVLTFWEATSSSFLNIDREKPVLVLVNKTEAAIKSTSLWRAEVPALARNPPEGNLRLVTWQMPCLDLVLLLQNRIQEVVGPNVGSQRRWLKRKGNMTCEGLGTDAQQVATYPPPFWMKEKLIEHGVAAKAIKELGFNMSWLMDHGFNASDLKEAGFSAEELKNANITARKLRVAGFSAEELKAAGFLRFMKKAGFSAKTLRKGNERARQLRQEGFSAGQLREAGFNAKELREAGFGARDLKNGGFEAKALKKAGFTAMDLKLAKFSAEKLFLAGFSRHELWSADFNMEQLSEAMEKLSKTQDE